MPKCDMAWTRQLRSIESAAAFAAGTRSGHYSWLPSRAAVGFSTEGAFFSQFKF